MTLIQANSTSAGKLAGPVRDVSIDYLRATVTLLVVAHHSALAYTTFAHFDQLHYLASTAPVVDEARWKPLDYLVSANDTFFMSLMFFISGLFVWRAVKRAGPARFLRQRIVRLGAPFVVAVSVLMPFSYWPSWLLAGGGGGFVSYWRLNVSGGWPSGPMWFIWLLLAFSALAAIAVPALSSWDRNSRSPETPVFIVVATMGTLGALLYLPLLLSYGFDGWAALLTPPLWFQLPRVGLYLLWFSAGTWLGRNGLPAILSPDGDLARRWPGWVGGAVIAFAAFALLPRLLTADGVILEPRRNLVEGLLWVASCTLGCFASIAAFRANVRRPHPLMDSLSRSAFAIYLLHYVFVVWIQFGLLGATLAPSLKFAITFVVATCASWATARLLLTVPMLRRIL